MGTGRPQDEPIGDVVQPPQGLTGEQERALRQPPFDENYEPAGSPE